MRHGECDMKMIMKSCIRGSFSGTVPWIYCMPFDTGNAKSRVHRFITTQNSYKYRRFHCHKSIIFGQRNLSTL